MSVIAVELVGGELDFPTKGSRFSIERNVGDQFPIHIHFGEAINQWNIRFHFTEEDFIEFADQMEILGE